MSDLIADVVDGVQVDPDLAINRELVRWLRNVDGYLRKHDEKYVSRFRKD